jgi:NADH-quinone oxidoreductase subunit L
LIFRTGLNTLLQEGFYLDRLYGALIAGPYHRLAGLLWRQVDEGGVDRIILGYGSTFPLISLGLRLWTTGKLSTYLKMMLLGMTVLVGILFMEVLTG